MRNQLTDEQLKSLFDLFVEAKLVPAGEYQLFCRWASKKSRDWILESLECGEAIC
ncbi:hypothetical protein VPHD148_0092 [Vibrio phage D148]